MTRVRLVNPLAIMNQFSHIDQKPQHRLNPSNL
jgi:hypothetical protein